MSSRSILLMGVVCGVLAAGAGFRCNEAEPSPRSGGAGGLGFTDVTAAAGLGAFRHVTGAFGQEWFPETMGGGAAFFDYDEDGWLDVAAIGGGLWPGHDSLEVPAVRLYRNNGDGTFTDQTEALALAALRTYGLGLAAADYDNDGDRDLFVASLYEDLLLRNDGTAFSDVSRTAGLGGYADWSTSSIFFDADRDGWADLYVGNYVEWDPANDRWCTMDGKTKSYCTPQAYTGVVGRFYHNNGDGTFSDWTERAGFTASPGKTLGVTELDFNRDGWSDLVVANDTQRDLLFENDGDGTFTEQGVRSGIAFDENGRARAGMGIDAADVDNDGGVTVAIGHFVNEMTGFYRYGGDGLFADRGAASLIGQASLMALTFGVVFFDADLDGWLDLFAANGHIAEEAQHVQDGVLFEMPQHLYLNRRDGTFTEVGAVLGGAFETKLVARGVAYGDYDRDGDLDVLLTENGGPLYLWRNDLTGGRSLRLHLDGRESNRDALGARVVAVAAGLRMERRVRTGSSFLTQSETAVTFGLGEAGQVDSLYVYWPGGRVDRFAGVRAGQELHLVEGSGRLEPLPRGAAPVAVR